ncbi:MAG: bifunctional diaminohydroxyphosphoribosylaminopyrimidine deaminase/5-amino-6-(5-phosphoribosylamino)uracil reductase RibD [Rhodospirillaceae bacterium]|nr:bifunctional diaminohydroxyphosphoribosylaminopyrimidine deaminase/5-amino-6-(5-phosphoribosylamino)uracil reductase RibD [Rhodospirillaceae bacterium]
MPAAAPPPDPVADQHCMAAALRLAERGLGDTWPNPSVGCVIVSAGRVVGRGTTRSGGRPHAETEALAMAGAAARGSTVYVTLEPCSHHGQTPPCADALAAAGVARVVVAATDPDPRVSGGGLAKMRAAGVHVTENVGRAEAAALNVGFFRRVTAGRPMFALKVAGSLDGRIALSNGASQWITGPSARAAGHLLRARFDAILAGSGTVLADDPHLTCRLPGYAGRPKVRVILDRRGRVTPRYRVSDTAAAPTWFYRAPGMDLRAVATDLAAKGLTRVLIEGGGEVAAAALRAGLIDEIYWFRGPQVLGGDGVPAVAGLTLDRLSDAPEFTPGEILRFGQDVLQVFRLAAKA